MALGVLAFYVGSNIYISVRLWKWSGLSGKRLSAVWGAVFLFLASAFIATELWETMPDVFLYPLNLLGGYYMAAYIFLLISVPIVHIVLGKEGGPMTTIVIICAAAIFTLVGAISASRIMIKSYTVPTNKTESFSIALVSDLHLGEIIREKQLQNMIDAINAVEADYVMIAGDVFDVGTDALRNSDRAGEMFRTIKAPKGIYACLGNHDGGFRGLDDEAAELLESWGVTVLQDQVITVNGINIAGRKDRGIQRMTPKDLLKDTDTSLFTVVLDHQPFEMDAERREGVDLILSGHTHGGQVFPFNLVTKAIFRIDYGMLTEDGCTMIVSSGLGTWGPKVRIGSRCEVVKIDIEKAE